MREQIVTEARSWLGTRFAHQGRVKKTANHFGGVDCLGLLVEVARTLELKKDGKLLASYDKTDYARLPDSNQLLDTFTELLDEVPREAMQPGDILLLMHDNRPQHLAIIGNYHGGNLSIIHAYAPARKVVEHALDEAWQTKIVKIFAF